MQRIKFRAFSDDTHKGVGGTGMIDEPKPTSRLSPIDRFIVVHFHDSNFFLDFCPSSALSSANQFPFVLSDFLPGPESDLGEKPKSINAAGFDRHGNGPACASGTS